MRNYKIAIAGTGYVGLSIATLLSQHHQVAAVDSVPEKVELINNRKSPIQDEYIEKYLEEKELHLTATLDAKNAYSNTDFVVIAAPTNVYSTKGNTIFRDVYIKNLGMKEIRGHESMFSWFVRRTPDTFIYVKAILEGQRSFLGHF